MKLTARQYAELLYEVTHEAKKSELPERLKRFLQLLVQHRVLVLVPRILSAFDEVWNENEGIVGLTIHTAEKSSPTVHTAIKKAFKGLAVQLQESIDPALIGGMSLRVGDTIIDGSVKMYLQNLRKELIRS